MKASLVALALTTVLGVSTAPALADDAPALKPTTLKGFKEAVKTAMDGTKLPNKVRVIGGAPRTVEIQYSSDGSTWVTARTRVTDAKGRLRFVVKPAPERNRWRLNVPATDAHGALTSAVKTFAVQVQECGKPGMKPSFPAVTATQVTASKTYARAYILQTYGWGDDQWLALEQLWIRESGWNHLALNPSSCATGIPQALPGDKMATHGEDWRTNPKTQIRWGASYIAARYGDPLKAWKEFQRKGWY